MRLRRAPSRREYLESRASLRAVGLALHNGEVFGVLVTKTTLRFWARRGYRYICAHADKLGGVAEPIFVNCFVDMGSAIRLGQ